MTGYLSDLNWRKRTMINLRSRRHNGCRAVGGGLLCVTLVDPAQTSAVHLLRLGSTPGSEYRRCQRAGSGSFAQTAAACSIAQVWSMQGMSLAG